MLTIKDGRIKEYIKYHKDSNDIKDIDPSYEMLEYICTRFELNIEQRYWLAFLYSTNYNAATVYYIYNEFPDYAGVNIGRMQRWWDANKDKLDFQTDCRWIRSRNQFVGIVEEYMKLCGNSQEKTYKKLVGYNTPIDGYIECYDFFKQIPWFGRFRLFLLLEAVHVVTGLNIEPDGLPLDEAESSRNGLCFALGRDDLLTGHDYGRNHITNAELSWLGKKYNELIVLMRHLFPDGRIDAWNVETTLCAYKKWHRGKRWPGYYIARQGKEIQSMSMKVKDGVCWDVLWNFRTETYPPHLLGEITGNDNDGAVWKKVGKGKISAFLHSGKGIRGFLDE